MFVPRQIVHDASAAVQKGAFTSFLSMRASIPMSWSQDQSGMKAKPPITMDIIEPFGALHTMASLAPLL